MLSTVRDESVLLTVVDTFVQVKNSWGGQKAMLQWSFA